MNSRVAQALFYPNAPEKRMHRSMIVVFNKNSPVTKPSSPVGPLDSGIFRSLDTRKVVIHRDFNSFTIQVLRDIVEFAELFNLA